MVELKAFVDTQVNTTCFKHRQIDFFSVYARRSNGTFVAWLSSSASALPIPVRDEFFYASFFSQNFAELA